MSNSAPHMVIGRVGFASNGEFVAHPEDASDLIAELEAQLDEAIWWNHRLRAALKKCAALSPQVSDEKHEILLETDPQNLRPPSKKSLS